MACPVGGHWPVWCVALAIQLVTRVKLSLRSTPKALEVVFGFLRGRTVTTTMMAWTTVRCWLMRLGLYALLRPLEQADDWAYLIDHTVQIGTVKCFAVVGVRLSQLPYPRRCLQREDLVLIALVPMQQSNAMTVKQALEEAELRTGVPRLIVSDEGGDVRGGIEQYCDDHPHTSSTSDMAYKGANLLRKLLEGDQRWPEFVAQLGQTKGKLQQTALAWCVGPSLRPKARFMNLGAPLRWARWCLRVLDQPWPPSAALSDRQRAALTKIDREQLEAKLGWLRDYHEAIEQWSQWHATPMTNLGGLCLELLSGKGLESAFLEGIGLKHETVLCHDGAVFPKTPMETRTVPWLHRLRLPPRGHLPNGHNGEPSVLSRSRVRCVSFSPLKSGNKSNTPPASTVAGQGFAGHCNPSS